MQASRCLLAFVLAGCGRLGFDDARIGTPLDADVDAADAVDPPDVCDPTAPFGTPVVVPVLSDPAVADGTLRLSLDELTGYFWSRRGDGVLARIYFASRPDRMTPFTVQPVTGLPTTGNDLDPTMPSNGDRILVFRHNVPGDDLWMATAVTDTDFTGAGPIASLNSASTDAQPFIAPGSDEITFQSFRSGGNGDLFRATRTSPTTFSPPVRIVELATLDEESDPLLSVDRLTLYFRSDAPADALTGHNIYVSTRSDPSALWGVPVLVPNVNSALDDGPSALSSDGCRLYISSDRLGTNDVFVATRGT